MNYNDKTVKTLEDWSFPEISNGKDGLTFKMSEKLKPLLSFLFCYYGSNHNHNKILKSDWLSTVLISALIGLYTSCLSNREERHAIARALGWAFILLLANKKKILVISFVLILEKLKTAQFFINYDEMVTELRVVQFSL